MTTARRQQFKRLAAQIASRVCATFIVVIDDEQRRCRASKELAHRSGPEVRPLTWSADDEKAGGVTFEVLLQASSGAHRIGYGGCRNRDAICLDALRDRAEIHIGVGRRPVPARVMRRSPEVWQHGLVNGDDPQWRVQQARPTDRRRRCGTKTWPAC